MNRYQWLLDSEKPRMLDEAIKELGVLELPGDRDSPTIMGWAAELDLTHNGYTHDSIPWCGLFMAVIALRAGWTPVKNPLWALNWKDFGQDVATAPTPRQPALGDVMVYRRNSGGHVNQYVGEDDSHYHGIGGNQSDAVTFGRYPKGNLVACRRAPWRIEQPKSVRPIVLRRDGSAIT